MSAYYNEIDPYCAQWLKNLIGAGHIAPGDIDERDIRAIHPDDVRGYTQCHFFAGIGGWPLALRLAGWSEDRAVWTGSCPCRPFSTAGKYDGVLDARHLWSAFRWLIAECGPPVIFGEQTSGEAGRQWLSGVRLDLEALGYACGCADLPAACAGAPHNRARLWWCGARPHTLGERQQGLAQQRPPFVFETAEFERLVAEALQFSARTGKAHTLVDGVPYRVGRLRAYGNAIVPQVGAEFICAVMECIP